MRGTVNVRGIPLTFIDCTYFWVNQVWLSSAALSYTNQPKSHHFLAYIIKNHGLMYHPCYSWFAYVHMKLTGVDLETQTVTYYHLP